ncbi:MAG: hypothetical protein IJ272_06445 [Clostridia bacterium]|nr:hypothetical protein [Clostridia bacterium]
MKITIGHLFYDLLNLYGENGNVMALEKALSSQGIKVEIKEFSLTNEPWNLEDLDLLYVGAGTEHNQMLALSTLMKYKEEITQMIMNNKFFICTGNSIELFGKYIDCNGENIETLGIFDYTTERTKKRIVSECIFNYEEIDAKILGFENHQGKFTGITEPLFTVEKGFSSDLYSKVEGFRKNNFYGTYLLGPILVRNPKFLEKICKDLILSKDASFEFKEFDFDIAQKAHDKFLSK